MPEDNDQFQINDIILSIPPQHISIDRQSTVHQWQTLRTRSSIKSNSGFSTISINVRATFTPKGNGFIKLKNLVSQFRVTPFCYVENQFLRSSIMSGSLDSSMVLALNQMQIVKDNNTTNALTVVFNFSWFNYFPYLTQWLYKKDIFSSASVKNPKESKPWIDMYLAEQDSAKKNSKNDSGSKKYGVAPSKLTGDMSFEYTQYASCNIVKYQKVVDRALERLRNQYTNEYKGASEDPSGETSKYLLKKATSDEEKEEAQKNIVGFTTSMVPDRNKDLQSFITKALDSPEYELFFFLPVVGADGKHIYHKPHPTTATDQNTQGDSFLLMRENRLVFGQRGLITTGISISFENILAEIPLVGYTYPTYQHIGSVDAVVNISLMTTSDSSVQVLSNLYSNVEDQAMKFRLVPQGHRNIKINNEIINMCGLRDFIPTNMTIDTVEGQPGTYQAVVTLVNNPLDAQTKEKIVPASQFLSERDLRAKTSDIMLKSLKIRDGIIDTETLNTEFVDIQDFSIVDLGSQFDLSRYGAPLRKALEQKYGKDIFKIREGETSKDVANRLSLLGKQIIQEKDGSEIELDKGFYEFQPENQVETELRHKAFADLCTTYGREIGFVWVKIGKLYQEVRQHRISELADEFDKHLYSKTDSDAPGIERIQRDVQEQFIKKQTLDPIASPQRGYKSALLPINDKIKWRLEADPSLTNEYKWIGPSKEQRIQAFKEKRSAELNRVVADKLPEYKEELDKIVRNWSAWTQKFIDEKIFQGKAIELDQFKEIRKALNNRAVNNHSIGCYPDFPLEAVSNRLEKEGSLAFKQVSQELRDAKNTKHPVLSNIGLGIFLQPDFYIYTNQNDDIDEIIPYEVQLRAAQSIGESSNRRLESETNWLKNIYNKEVLTEQVRDKIAKDVVRTGLAEKGNSEFWKGKEEARRSFESTQIDGFAPYTLEGEVGCSIVEESERRGPVDLVNVSNKLLDEKGKVLSGEAAPGLITHKERIWPDNQLKPRAHHRKIKHRFDSNSIASNSTDSSPIDLDPEVLELLLKANKVEGTDEIQWTSPILDGWWITSLFGQRILPDSKTGKPRKTGHKGIDFAAGGATRQESKNKTDGAPIYAAADGTIVDCQPKNASPIENPKSSRGGLIIKIKHKNNITSWYMHLRPGGNTQKTFERFRKEGSFAVKGRELIADCGNSGVDNNGKPYGQYNHHLHFEIKVSGSRVNPLGVSGLRDKILHRNGWGTKYKVGNGAFKQRMRELGIDGAKPSNGQPDTQNILAKSVEQLEKDLINGQGYSLLRAYPTFKLFFIESDLGERKVFGFDDFFQYSSVESITVIRSRKIAADMVLLNLTNVSGVLSNRRFRDTVGTKENGEETNVANKALEDGKVTTEDRNNPQNTNTAKENPISSLLLQPGIQVQLRLGYNNHPEELETVFNGVITDVQFTENDDMVQLVCQSFAIELVQNYYGNAKTFGGFLSSTGITGRLLEELMATPEVVHFGRWEGEGDAKNSAYGILKKKWKPVPQPYDDNIFAPTGRGLMGLFDSTPTYQQYQSTVWDTFQEMTLRHPSYVASPVPYEGKYGARMTMFFGVPDQLYFARDPTFYEDDEMRTLQLEKFVDEARNTIRTNRYTIEDATDPSKNPKETTEEDIASSKDEQEDDATKKARGFWLKKRIKNYALDQGFIKPFRNYHVVTSTQHIIANNIESSSNVFNTVTLQYGDNSPSVDDTTASIVVGDAETFTLSADAAIQEEETREMFAQYPNCVGYEMAKQYAVSLLFNSMKECYRGTLTITGNPKIKPFDICYIFDEYTDMFGPIEVEQVVHRFSQKQGFITEITPDMTVHVNQETTMSSSDAMGLIAEAALKKIGLRSLSTGELASVGAIAAGGALALSGAGAAASAIGAAVIAADLAFSPIASMFFNSSENALGQGGSSAVGLIGSFIFSKLITRTQLAHPFRYSPLVKHGRPMVGALPVKKTKGSFFQKVDHWLREAEEGVGVLLTDTYQKFNPNNWFGKTQGDWKTIIKGDQG